MLDYVHRPPDFIHHRTSSSSLSFVILHACTFFGSRLSQPITYLELQGKLPSFQLLQNHSRRDHRQVWSSYVTRQDLQSSSYKSGVTITYWYQSFVIKPDDIRRRSFVIQPVSLTNTNDIPKVSPCQLASKPWITRLTSA